MDELPTFCINVPSATHRLERMKSRFDKLKMTVIFWTASTPETLGSLPYAEYLNSGQRGCAKSHYDIWKYQVEHKIPRVFILEDDAVFRKDVREILNEKLKTIDKLDSQWDMLLLNASEKTVPLETWVIENNQCLSAGYVLSLRGAEELVCLNSKTVYASDWSTQLLQRRGHSYTYFQWLVIQDGIDSIIRGEMSINHDWEKVVRLLESVNYSLEKYSF